MASGFGNLWTVINVSMFIDECKVKMGKISTVDACCAPLLTAPLDGAEADELASAFKALADPVRLRLLSLIAAAPAGTACSCDLEVPVGKSQSTVSHHLAVLADAGLITKEKVGRWVNCSIVPQRVEALREVLSR